MRRPGFFAFFAAFLSFSACAKDPDRGTAQTCGAGERYTAPTRKLSHPNKIISRGAQVFASPTTNAAAVVNGVYHGGGWNAGSPTTATPAWVAIKLTAGPARLLVSWDDNGTYNYQDPAGTTVYGLPADYHFEVSSDSTNGMDGTWAMAGAPVTGNHVRTRAHALDFAGKSWIKMVITAAPAEASSGVQIGEIDVHDISAAGTGLPDDTWFFMGDSITAFAYDRANPPSFAALIDTTTAHAYFPAMINGGIGGELSSSGLARLDDMLALNPDYRFWAITYGTNDSWGNKTDASVFRGNLQMMIDKLKAAGREPVLSRVPYAADGAHETLDVFNAAIDDLTCENQLQTGPDLTAYFMAHSGELQDDKVHPAPAGRQAMNQEWADAMRVVYP